MSRCPRVAAQSHVDSEKWYHSESMRDTGRRRSLHGFRVDTQSKGGRTVSSRPPPAGS